MSNSLKLQLDVKNNAEELRNYMLDLNNWEEEMKRKEKALSNEKPNESVIPPPRNKIKRSKLDDEKKPCEKPKRISGYDYSAWDKYDVEKALADLDKEDEKDDEDEEVALEENSKEKEEDNKKDDSELKGSDKFSLIDEAFYEKEMGNKFVKNEQWNDAIKCYTSAINLDPSNAIYYANRSLCFLKLKNLKSAETDATTAIQLDKKYVKAYQRRAYARLALGQLAEAKSDFEEILNLEPKNALARVEINKIDEKLKKDQVVNKKVGKKNELLFNPKNMFKSENTEKKQSVNITEVQPPALKTPGLSKNETVRPKQKSKTTITNTDYKNTINVSVKNEGRNIERGDGDKATPIQSSESTSSVFKPLPEWCRIIHPVNLPPHKRSKKPLKRIEITVTDKDEDIFGFETENESLNVVEKKKEEKPETYQKNEEKKTITYQKNEEEELKNERLSFEVPKTAIQFRNCWKVFKKNPDNLYSYVKNIPAAQLPQIFENSLESDFFSDIVTFLASDDEIEKDPIIIYDFLWHLSKVKRFSSLILFLSEADKKCVRKAVSQTEKIKSVEEISELLKLYELKV